MMRFAKREPFMRFREAIGPDARAGAALHAQAGGFTIAGPIGTNISTSTSSRTGSASGSSGSRRRRGINSSFSYSGSDRPEQISFRLCRECRAPRDHVRRASSDRMHSSGVRSGACYPHSALGLGMIFRSIRCSRTPIQPHRLNATSIHLPPLRDRLEDLSMQHLELQEWPFFFRQSAGT